MISGELDTKELFLQLISSLLISSSIFSNKSLCSFGSATSCLASILINFDFEDFIVLIASKSTSGCDFCLLALSSLNGIVFSGIHGTSPSISAQCTCIVGFKGTSKIGLLRKPIRWISSFLISRLTLSSTTVLIL